MFFRVNYFPVCLRILSLVFVTYSITPNTTHACEWKAEYISATAIPKEAKTFDKIDRSMTLKKIIQRLGPAYRDVGSGLHVLEWKVADGRVFHVSVASACDKPIAIGFRDP
jgi:hypothetical protein